jgi:hypothetical protein
MNAYREKLARIILDIEIANPGWHVWYVLPAMGGITWCARYGPDRPRVKVLHADSSDGIAKLISEASRESSHDGNSRPN